MQRGYSIRLIALTLAVPLKWVDNLLSHHHLPGVSGGRQGRQRHVTEEGLLAIELSRILSADFGVPVSRAVALARAALDGRDENGLRLAFESGATLVFSTPDIENRLRAQMIVAIEAVGHIPRGRPPRAKPK